MVDLAGEPLVVATGISRDIVADQTKRLPGGPAWSYREGIARYIDGFYDPVGRHSALGCQSPVQL